MRRALPGAPNRAGAGLAILLLGCGLSACRPAPSPPGAEAGLAVEVAVSPDPVRVGPARITIDLKRTTGEPVRGARVTLEGNMAHAGMVPVFATARESESDAGRYSADLELTMAGDWFLLIDAALPDGSQVRHRHSLPGVQPR